MYELIQKLNTNPNVSMTLSDDGTIVFLEKQFELDMQTTPPTVIEKDPEVIGATTAELIREGISERNTELNALELFLTDNDL